MPAFSLGGTGSSPFFSPFFQSILNLILRQFLRIVGPHGFCRRATLLSLRVQPNESPSLFCSWFFGSSATGRRKRVPGTSPDSCRLSRRLRSPAGMHWTSELFFLNAFFFPHKPKHNPCPHPPPPQHPTHQKKKNNPNQPPPPPPPKPHPQPISPNPPP